jgi:uncharacterized protein HemY
MNYRILVYSLGSFNQGDIVPAYALEQSNPGYLVSERFIEPTDDAVTTIIDTENLAKQAPSASSSLITAHAKLQLELRDSQVIIKELHEKVVELKDENEALIIEVEALKKARDESAVERAVEKVVEKATENSKSLENKAKSQQQSK